MQKQSFQKNVVGSLALAFMGMNMTKRYYNFPHFHKDKTKPLTLANGELHPYDHQPRSAAGMMEYTKHSVLN